MSNGAGEAYPLDGTGVEAEDMMRAVNADCGEICGVCDGSGGGQYASTAAQRDAELAMVENVVETVSGVGNDIPDWGRAIKSKSWIWYPDYAGSTSRRAAVDHLLSILSYNAAVDAIA